MLSLFKKAPTPDRLVNRLRKQYAQVVGLVAAIEGPFPYVYEAGVFVASIATTKVLTFKKTDPPAFADEFNGRWINHIVDSYEINGVSPEYGAVVTRLQEQFPIYRDLFLKVLDPDQTEKRHDNAVQLMWELFANCTGKKAPESGNFLRLSALSSDLVGIGIAIWKDVRE